MLEILCFFTQFPKSFWVISHWKRIFYIFKLQRSLPPLLPADECHCQHNKYANLIPNSTFEVEDLRGSDRVREREDGLDRPEVIWEISSRVPEVPRRISSTLQGDALHLRARRASPSWRWADQNQIRMYLWLERNRGQYRLTCRLSFPSCKW